MSSVADETTSSKETPASQTPASQAPASQAPAKEAPAKPAPAKETPKDEARDGGKQQSQRPGRRRVSAKEVAHGAKVGTDAVRNRVASLVWIIAVVCAVIVVLGAIMVALGSGVRAVNPVVEFINHTADTLAGPFGKIFSFQKKHGGPDVVMNTVLGYGVAALVYLIGGKIVSRVIRP